MPTAAAAPNESGIDAITISVRIEPKRLNKYDPPTPTNTPIPPTPTNTPSVPECVVLEPGKNLGFDTYLNQDKPDDRKGDNSEMRVKTEASKLQRPLMRFDLSSIPPTANVQSMTLSLWVKGLNGPAVDVHAHQVLESWNELEATWNDRDRDAGVPWAEAGGTSKRISTVEREITISSSVISSP